MKSMKMALSGTSEPQMCRLASDACYMTTLVLKSFVRQLWVLQAAVSGRKFYQFPAPSNSSGSVLPARQRHIPARHVGQNPKWMCPSQEAVEGCEIERGGSIHTLSPGQDDDPDNLPRGFHCLRIVCHCIVTLNLCDAAGLLHICYLCSAGQIYLALGICIESQCLAGLRKSEQKWAQSDQEHASEYAGTLRLCLCAQQQAGRLGCRIREE